MKIGTLLNIELKKAGTKAVDKYRCKVIEMNEHYLMIDYPINEKTNKTSFLPKGIYFSVSYLGSDQVIYQFNSSIVANIKLNVPALALKLPKDEDIKRIQRREFVRIETTIDVAIHSTNQTFSPFTTVTSDISGGGLSIIVPNNHNLEMGHIVDTWLTLHMHDDKYEYINTKAEVVFIKTLNSGIQTVSLKFSSIEQLAQQKIIRFCFEKQRDLLQKELR